ncbi:MAG: anti-sigma factor [Vulcanimicrobiota bacterium]
MSCCGRIKELLAEYLDQELPDDLCAELETHLSHCRPCQVVVDTTRTTIAFYRELEPMPLPEGVERRLLSCLRGDINKSFKED